MRRFLVGQCTYTPSLGCFRFLYRSNQSIQIFGCRCKVNIFVEDFSASLHNNRVPHLRAWIDAVKSARPSIARAWHIGNGDVAESRVESKGPKATLNLGFRFIVRIHVNDECADASRTLHSYFFFESSSHDSNIHEVVGIDPDQYSL